MCGGALPWWKEEFDKDKESTDKKPEDDIPTKESNDSCG